MEDKFATLEQLFLDRRQLGERFIAGIEKNKSHPYWLETSNNLIKDEVLRLADEFAKAEAEVTNEEST